MAARSELEFPEILISGDHSQSRVSIKRKAPIQTQLSVQSHLMNARRQVHRVKGSKSLERNSDQSNAIRASNHLLEQIPARDD